MKRTIKLAALVSVLSLILAACASSSDETTTTSEVEATTTKVEETTDTTEVPEEMGDSIADVVAGNDDFSTLLAAVEAGALTEALADPDATLTVFAPTNDAFDAALDALGLSAEELLADTETLAAILTYHVLGDVVTSGDLVSAGTEEITMETLSGEELIVIIGDAGNVTFRDQSANVTTADVEASNSVIHIIDGVLLPPSVAPSGRGGSRGAREGRKRVRGGMIGHFHPYAIGTVVIHVPVAEARCQLWARRCRRRFPILVYRRPKGIFAVMRSVESGAW